MECITMGNELGPAIFVHSREVVVLFSEGIRGSTVLAPCYHGGGYIYIYMIL